MEFTKSNFDDLRKDFANDLKKLEKKYSLNINLGNITYKESSFTSKVTFSKSTGNAKKDEKVAFLESCESKTVPASWYGKTFTMKGKKYKVVGINNKARKNCIIVKSGEQKYIVSKSQVISRF